MPPIQPINNLGGAMRPAISPQANSGPIAHQSRGGVFDSLDIEKIGKGRLMTEGSYHKQFGTKKYSGLKGQLAKIKREGRHGVTQNLSTKNIEQIHDLITNRIKHKSVSSSTFFSRRDKMAIMKESKKLVKTAGSDFTWEDRKDLKKTVDTLQQKFKDKALHRNEESIAPLNTPASLPLNNPTLNRNILP